MARNVNLIEYLPLFIANYKDMKHIMSAENPEFKLLADEAERIQNNQYIISCDLVGIAKFERLLKIVPSAEDTLSSRVSRVLIRWNDVAQYTWKVLLQKLTSLCGDDFELNTDWDSYILEIVTHLDLYGQVEELENIIDYMLPANIKVVAKNMLNYKCEAKSYVGAGFSICEIFELTDSYKVKWDISNAMSLATVNNSTCELILTDSFKEEFINSDNLMKTITINEFTEII